MTKTTIMISRTVDIKRSFVFLVILNCFFFYFDPWSLSKSSQRASDEIALHLFAPLYGLLEGAKASANKISVVLIDDNYLTATQDSFPLDYWNQYDLLESIIAAPQTKFEATQGKPMGLFIDLVFQFDRGDLLPFADNVAAPDGSSLAASTAAGQVLMVPPQEITGFEDAGEYGESLFFKPAPGILSADLFQTTDVLADQRSASQQWWDTRESIINLQKAPSILSTPPLTYALVPRGAFSPAVKLFLWTCAVMQSRKAAETDSGDLPFEHLQGCGDNMGGSVIDPSDVRSAARAYAESRIAFKCAADWRALDFEGSERAAPKGYGLFSRRDEDISSFHDICRRHALDFLASAGIVEGDDSSTNSPSTSKSYAEVMVSYRRARWEGIVEGAHRMYLAPCEGEGFLQQLLSGFRDLNGNDCEKFAKRRDNESIGPATTVLWGAGPQDGGRIGGQPRPNGLDSPAAPYTWATEAGPNGVPVAVRDPCADYRLSWEDEWSSIVDVLNRFFDRLLPAYGRATNKCGYHAQADAVWTLSDDLRTQHWLSHIADDRIVMIGASVASATDKLDMRGTYAPGVWGHAMALDNLLTLGADYRGGAIVPQSFDGFWVANRFRTQMVEFGFEITLVTALILTGLKQRLSHIVYIWGMRKYIDKHFLNFSIDLTVSFILSIIVMLPLAISFMYYTNWPFIDWIGIAATAATVWVLADIGEGQVKREQSNSVGIKEGYGKATSTERK